MSAERFLRRPDREQLNLATRNLVRRAARRIGLDVVRADYYSPILDIGTTAPSTWERPAPMHGLELDLDGQLGYLEEQLKPFIEMFAPPLQRPPDPHAFYLENAWFGPMDAHILYAMLRHRPPERVLELGSGYSTLVIDQALRANGEAGSPGTHDLVDPHPSPLLASLRGNVNVRAQSAASVPEALFTSLRGGDVLFVDTTHVVRPGSDVVRLVLEVLPLLAPGVVVHFHDIFRPFEYPRILYERFNVHWQEHYLLQAFLAYNSNFTVVCANHALWRLRRERVKPLFTGLRDGMEPSSFWFVAGER